MKTEELVALGLTEEQATQVLAVNGRDIEKHKKRTAELEAEQVDLKTRLSTAEDTLKKFEGIEPDKIQQEVQSWKTKAENAEKEYATKLTQRDQQDWLKSKLDGYGVTSPYARKALIADCLSEDSGLKWKDGGFFGFDDYMKSAKEKDANLYQTAEEKKAAEDAAKQKEKAPTFTGKTGDPPPASEKYMPPKIF